MKKNTFLWAALAVSVLLAAGFCLPARFQGHYVSQRVETMFNSFGPLLHDDGLSLTLDFGRRNEVTLTDDFGHNNSQGHYHVVGSNLLLTFPTDTLCFSILSGDNGELVLQRELRKEVLLRYLRSHLPEGNVVTGGDTYTTTTTTTQVTSNMGPACDSIINAAVAAALANIEVDDNGFLPGMESAIVTTTTTKMVNDSVVYTSTDSGAARPVKITYYLSKK